jgi:hypothetical protein
MAIRTLEPIENITDPLAGCKATGDGSIRAHSLAQRISRSRCHDHESSVRIRSWLDMPNLSDYAKASQAQIPLGGINPSRTIC